MSLNNRSKKRNSDQPFDLDNYLEEKSAEYGQEQEFESESVSVDRKYTNILIVAVAITSFIWYMDWTPRAIFQSLFGDSNVEVVTGTPVVVEIPPINIDIPEINIPEIDIDIDPDIGGSASNLGPIVAYLQELQNQGLLEDKISAFEARQVYDAGVPISYLLELDRRGYLSELSFIEIGEFYKNEVPFEYLDQLKERGYYGRLSFIDVSEYYRNDVSFDYLDIMDEAGYLDELSFVHVTEYYRNGVTPEFLDELKESGLYNSLSFIDVVEIYKSQN